MQLGQINLRVYAALSVIAGCRNRKVFGQQRLLRGIDVQASLEVQIDIAEPARRAAQRALDVGELVTPRFAVVEEPARQIDNRIAVRHFRIEMKARLKVARHGIGEPAGFDLHILQRDPLPLHLVLPIDGRMGYADTVDIERKRCQFFIAYLQVVVIGRAILVARQVDARAVDLDMIEHQLLFQQRQPGDIQTGIVDRSEFARAVALAQQHLPRVQAQLGEECHLDIALQHQLALGVILDVLDDLRLEIVHIEREYEHDDDDRDDHQDEQHPGERIAVMLLGKRLGKGQPEQPQSRDQHADDAVQPEQPVLECFQSSFLADLPEKKRCGL